MAFRYEPLQRTQKEIRLITLQPGDADGTPLQIHIETATLDSPGVYSCLSYVWGPPEPKRSIELNGCPFDVLENLYLALLRLRLPDKPRRLWIDAICINQNDIEEREAQVSIMHNIYATAANVIGWIGEDDGAADRRAIDFMKELAVRSRSYLNIDDGEIGSVRSLDEETVRWFESVTPLGLVDSIWLDFTALIDRPWFSRIWIVQEVVMGREVTLKCGPHEFDWMDIFCCALFVNANAELMQTVAAPGCLKHHDPQSAEFYFNSLPLYHLLRAADNIQSVGYLAMSQREQRMIQDIVEPHIRPHISTTAPTHPEGLPVHYWGTFSDSGHVLIRKTRASSNPSDPPPQVSDPSFIRRHLIPAHAPETVGHILAMVDGTIPIYSIIPNRPPESSNTTSNHTSESSSSNTTTNTTNSTATTKSLFPRPSSLYPLTARFRRFHSTDPRDKIYALLGIAASVQHIPHPQLPPVSYAPATRILDVMWDLIETDVRATGSLAFLSDACGVAGQDSVRDGGGEGWPSWMPLWYDDVSALKGTPDGLGRFIGCQASGGERQAEWVVMPRKEKRELGVAGLFVGRVRAVGEVYDRDGEESRMFKVRREWAGMVGLEKLEEMREVLLGLRLQRRLSDEQADAALERMLGRLTAEQRARYQRFVGTLLASGSDTATAALQHPVAAAGTAAMAQMLRAGKQSEHFFNLEKMHEAGRVSTVCHGRRMCVFDTDDSPGYNFGLCPADTQNGDWVALISGSPVLYIIRALGIADAGSVFGMVGEAYVHNWMNGQLLEKIQVPDSGEKRLGIIRLR